ncbi:MAG: rRNA pseudouridine synthase [Lachnospiraceae bacterium]|nr:rRNA pseudouridine synthase [Lachnospiraceae bacterium]
MFMRIDRLLCEMNIGSRSQVKELIKKGLVLADGEPVKRPEMQVDERKVRITCKGQEYGYSPYVYYMMNKPPGVITATSDEKERTVLDLLREHLLKEREDLTGIPINDIFPAGRLDKDTVGLLLLTNDGALAHRLLSPKRHVPKKYFVRTNGPITRETADFLEKGVDMGDGEMSLPARCELTGSHECHLTITEGKFHQVKRMFQAAGLTVTYLKRLSMGSLTLDGELKEGQVRELTQKEVTDLCSMT